MRVKKFLYDEITRVLVEQDSFSLDNYFIDTCQITQELEFDAVFTFSVSSSEIEVIDNSFFQTEFTNTNLATYVYGVEILRDGQNAFVGQVVPESIYFDEGEGLWNFEARGWFKWAYENYGRDLFDNTATDLGNFLQQTFGIGHPIINDINVNVSDDSDWNASDQDTLIEFYSGTIEEEKILGTPTSTTIQLATGLTHFEVLLNTYGIIGRTILAISSLGLTRGTIVSYSGSGNPITFTVDGWDNGTPLASFTGGFEWRYAQITGYKDFLTRRHIFNEAQKHYGAYAYIDENYTLQFINRQLFTNPGEAWILNDVIFESNHIKRFFKENDYDGILISQKTDEGGGVTEISWRALYYENEELIVKRILSESGIEKLPEGLGFLDLRQQLGVRLDEDLRPTSFYSNMGYKIFPSRSYQSTFDDYKSLIEKREMIEFQMGDTADAKLLAQFKIGNKNYTIQKTILTTESESLDIEGLKIAETGAIT